MLARGVGACLDGLSPHGRDGGMCGMAMDPIRARPGRSGGKAAALCAVAALATAMSAAAPVRADSDGLVGLEGDYAFAGNMGAAGLVNLHAHAKIIGFGDGVLKIHYDTQGVDQNGHQISSISSNVTIPLAKIQITTMNISDVTQFVFTCVDNTPCMSIAFDQYYNELKTIDQVQNPEPKSSAFFNQATAPEILAKLCRFAHC
jgi:hypothetical protein